MYTAFVFTEAFFCFFMQEEMKKVQAVRCKVQDHMPSDFIDSGRFYELRSCSLKLAADLDP